MAPPTACSTTPVGFCGKFEPRLSKLLNSWVQRKKTSARLPNGRLPLVEPVQPRSTKPRYQPEKQDDSLLFANEMSHTWGKTLDNRIACSTPIQESCEQIFNFSKNVSPIAIYRDEVDKQASLNISILTNLQSSRSFDPLPATKFEPLTSDSHHSKSEALAVPDELGEENNGYSNDAKQVHKAQVNYPICPLTTYAFSYQKPARLLFRRIERNVAAKCSHEFPKCPLAAFDFLPENKR